MGSNVHAGSLSSDALRHLWFGGHPVQTAVALKSIEIMRRERIVENVAERQDEFHAARSRLLELPIVGDPVVQTSPPLVAGPEELETIVDVLGGALEEASEWMSVAR